MQKLLALFAKLAHYRKSVVYAIGAIATLVVQYGIGNTTVQHYAQLIVLILTGLGVYQVRNKPLPAKAVADGKLGGSGAGAA